MRILLCQRVGGAFGYITDGILNALKDRGHMVQRWGGDEQSWFQFNPDLYIGCSGHKQDIPKDSSTKIAIHVNPYGPVNMNGINESRENIDWVTSKNPDVVFGYGFDSDRIIWSYWEQKNNIKWVPMPTAGDKVMFRNLNIERDLDVVYLGGRWEYKGLTIDPYLLPVLRDDRITFKLHGWGDWPNNICSGVLEENHVNKFFNRGKICPCMSERHTHQYGIDIPERAWKVALCGTLAIHDPVPTLRDKFKSLVISQNPENFKDLCIYYSRPSNKDERDKLAKEQQEEVLANHTYHNRLSVLFDSLDLKDDAEFMLA